MGGIETGPGIIRGERQVGVGSGQHLLRLGRSRPWILESGFGPGRTLEDLESTGSPVVLARDSFNPKLLAQGIGPVHSELLKQF